ncbi:MAG TPA: serine--tRNA ligase [Bacillota bacterium]|nr:serine--tRNA ligase [Bacillota bacterium]HPJ85808.1 serine--tRNA ligase [Bacillota bacterium]HPQ61533.1 serine--tRNA ligase [Bacillota bacterium]HRX91344.1 serine--tRNA ligase [Candidatus Izemoplasmatales bacterium]
MLDIKQIRANPELIIGKLNRRGGDFSYLYDMLETDRKRREAILEVEALKAKKNEISKQIGQFKREGKSVESILKNMDDFSHSIAGLEDAVRQYDDDIRETLLKTPNMPADDIPNGKDDSENVEIKRNLEPTQFDFVPKSHYDLGEALDILDFQRAGKISGARFVVYKGLGARLERSLIQFMMDLHANKHGYTEIMPPYLVNETSMYGTGQFPKFMDEAFKVNDDRNLYLNPTAEVPTINLHRDEVIDKDLLPIKYVSYTTAFRKEAGSAGKDTKGIIRQHQFNKVELIKFTKPEESYKEQMLMLEDAEDVLKLLKIPYHVVVLCAGDLGFSMCKTYDIEVWLPSENRYREISSVSNAEDYQARRANIKYRPDTDGKLEYVHTLNGSGLAVGRTLVAVMENYQKADGTIEVPEVLRKYMGTDIISK